MLPFENTPEDTNSIGVLLKALLAPASNPTTAQPNIADIFKGLLAARDPVGTANRLTGLPSYAPGSQSPFNTGFFKSAAERYADMLHGTGAYAPTGQPRLLSTTLNPLTPQQGLAAVAPYIPDTSYAERGLSALMVPRRRQY